MRALPIVALLTALACAWVAAPAGATISPAQTLDGPSSDIVSFDGVAMAPDGTGGLVYRRLVDGRPHVFAARFADGVWSTPERVDVGQRFDSSFPAIGAGNGGRLVVVWVQDFGEGTDRMFSAALDPGARRFQAPVPVDLNVGEATATYPSVAMNAGGLAYVTYLVTSAGGGGVPPGYVNSELRVARYSGALWSGFGFPLNRNPSSPVRAPDAGTAPKVAIDLNGNGLLAWQEPDDSFVDRVYARRLFGSTPGIVLPVSPATWNEKPLRGPADEFSLDLAGFGQGVVAWRQQPGEGGALKGTRIMAAILPETFSPEAARFGAPRIVDGAGDDGPAAPTGPASASAAPGGRIGVAFGLGAQSLAAGADPDAVGAPTRLDDGATTEPGDPRIDIAKSGAAALAWRVQAGRRGALALSERRSDGVTDTRLLSGTRGGIVGDFALAGSGLGDALAGFEQGSGAYAQIAGAVVDAPPDAFAVQAPLDYVRDPEVKLAWDPPAHAVGGVTYAVTVDDETVAEKETGTAYRLDTRELDDGVSGVSVIATDGSGQETTSFPAELRLDRRGPAVQVLRRGRSVSVRVADGRRGQVSGVAAGSVRVTFGDGRGARGKGRMTHPYRRPGRYRVTVRARDRVGNATALRRVVVVR